MARTVIWSFNALDDIEHILNYLAADSPGYASDLLDDFVLIASTLTEFPNRGRRSPDPKMKDAREIFIQNYRMIYDVTVDQIEILAVVHMARDRFSIE